MKRWLNNVGAWIAGFAVGCVLVGAVLHGQPAAVEVKPAPLPRELTSYRDVVKGILPAVVSIETRARPGLRPAPTFLDDPALPDGLRRPDPNRLGFGSGFFVDPTGVVVTNYHVIEGAETAIVNLVDGRKFTSKDIRFDRRTDLAVILLDVKDVRFPVLELGDSDAMEIGDRVLAVGAPFGLAGSVTHGIVSAKGRGLNLNMYEDFLQTDAPINPGNSGGPLVSLDGKVVGINAAIKSKTGGFQGVGLAVASNLAKNVVTALRTTGVVKRGYLGAHIRELDANVADRVGVPKEGGVVLAEIYEKTPAEKAGLKAGDIVTAISGQPIKDGNTLQRIVAALPIDKAVDIDIVRGGKAQRLPVVIEEQPAEYGVAPSAPTPRPQRPAPAGASLDALGVEIAELTDQLADDLGYKRGTKGVVVMRIQEGSLASATSLRMGTLISKIDDMAVTSIATARQALQNADLRRGIVLHISTAQGGVNYVLMRSLR